MWGVRLARATTTMADICQPGGDVLGRLRGRVLNDYLSQADYEGLPSGRIAVSKTSTSFSIPRLP